MSNAFKDISAEVRLCLNYLQFSLRSFLSVLGCLTVAAQTKLSPETLTVLRGGEAHFTCSTSSKEWTAMVWLLNGRVALTISNLHGVLAPYNPNVTAQRINDTKEDSWVLVLKNVERLQEGEVTCDIPNSGRKTASLFVQGMCARMYVCVFVTFTHSSRKAAETVLLTSVSVPTSS